MKYINKRYLLIVLLVVFFICVKKGFFYLESAYINICISGNAGQVELYMDGHYVGPNDVLSLEKSTENLDLWRFIENDIESRSIDVMPIYIAAGNQDPGVLKILFERGATFNPMGIHALERALLEWRVQNVRFLLDVFKERQGSPDVPDNLSEVATYALVTFFGNGRIGEDRRAILRDLLAYEAFSGDPQAMLLSAARRVMDPEFYLILEENGIDLPEDISPLLAAAATEGGLESTVFFLQRGGDPNTVVTEITYMQNSSQKRVTMPLISKVAVWNGTPEILAVLLEAGANPNRPDSEGKTALARLNDAIQTERQREMENRVKQLEERRSVLIQAGAHE